MACSREKYHSTDISGNYAEFAIEGVAADCCAGQLPARICIRGPERVFMRGFNQSRR